MKTNWMVLLVAVLFPLAGYAYIPPANFILDRTLKAREGLKTLELIAEVRDLQRNVSFNETLRLDFLGARYWEVATESGGALVASQFGKLAELKDFAQAWIELGYESSSTRVREALQKYGILPNDKTETRLIRQDDKIQWAWGAENQVEIEKDKFVWAGFQDARKNAIVVREQARFPRVILVRLQGQDRFQYTLRSFKINTPAKWNTQALVAPQGVLADPVRDWVTLVR